jgi:uncharacterized protein
MRFAWDEEKRIANLKDHGLDFVDAEKVFSGLTFTVEDQRFDYGERRFITLGVLDTVPVSIAHTEFEEEIRVISFRKAKRREAATLFAQVQDQYASPPVPARRRDKAHRRASRAQPRADRKRHREKRPEGRPS